MHGYKFSRVKVRSNNAFFHQIFNLLDQVSRIESIFEVITRYNFYNRFSIYTTYSIFLLYGTKSLWHHDSHQRVDGKSDALQIFNRLQTTLSTYVVTRYDFSRKQNRMRKSDVKSDGKSYHLTASLEFTRVRLNQVTTSLEFASRLRSFGSRFRYLGTKSTGCRDAENVNCIFC